jgi:hypothetical protein
MSTVRGGCLCGGVRYDVELPFSDANYCHCSRCRKHSGAEASVQARAPREQFTLISGKELIRVYEPDDGAVRAFCSVCGSSLFGRRWPEGDEIAIRMGTLDDDPEIRPEFRTVVDDRAPWAELPDDGIPGYAEGHPGI